MSDEPQLVFQNKDANWVDLPLSRSAPALNASYFIWFAYIILQYLKGYV